MPAPLVPHAAIPDLASRVTAKQRPVLEAIQRAGYVRNQRLDAEMLAVLEELTKMGLVDPAYEGSAEGPLYFWASNGNGQRVLRYLTGIRSGPHYEIAAKELAAWLEEKGNDRWWSVDGDPRLAGMLEFPCPADELADGLRRIDEPLLVQAKKEDTDAKGQKIGKEKLDAVVGKVADSLHLIRAGALPSWSGDRQMYLCWKGLTNDWLLSEDSEATRQMQGNELGKGVDTADANKE
jgi:hypothetical protein